MTEIILCDAGTAHDFRHESGSARQMRGAPMMQ
jgi:hypothetical protein